MDINTFLDKTVGDWFSQRTIYKINQNEVDNSKANVTISLLTATNSKVSSLAQQHHFDLDLNIGAISSQWDNSPDWGKPKQKGESLMLLFQKENEINQGKIVRVLGNNTVKEGEYSLADDESLTLILKENSQIITERIWFASDNLRLRNTVITDEGKVIETAFYSEIKRIVKPDSSN